MKVFYDSDADLDLIKDKQICIVGYGSQGHAHALNLRDSGVKNIVIALRKDSSSVKKAKDDGFKVVEVDEGAKTSDICMVLVPDEKQADRVLCRISARHRILASNDLRADCSRVNLDQLAGRQQVPGCLSS